jgi:membrane fusion protein
MQSLFRQEVVDHRNERLFGEVVLGQPLRLRLAAVAIVLVVGIAAAWVVLGSYARTETAKGILVTDVPAPKLYAPAPGTIARLNVREGSIVEAGQVVAVIELDRRNEDGDQAARISLDTIAARAALSGQQMRLASARLASEQERMITAASAAETQANELSQQIALQAQIVASNREMFDRMGAIMERGFVSRFEYERRRQTWLASQQQMASLSQQREAQLSQAAQARSQLSGLTVQGASERAELQMSLQALEQQRAGMESQRSYVISAPVSGTVTAVQATRGSMAMPNSPLMTIVPHGGQVRAEVYAPSRAIGFVHRGQETKLLFDAFPYQRFGSFSGRISNVSRVIIDPRETNIPVALEEPVYRITVTLDRQHVDAFGQRYRLQPGMALTANIVLERQSFLNWLLTPIRAVANRS